MTIEEPLKRLGRAIVPHAHREDVRIFVEKCINFGFARYCPCCNSHVRRFKPFGVRRSDALCPVCGSFERHRLMMLYMKRRTDLFDGSAKKMLHIAPETQLGRVFEEIPNLEYISADLSSPRAMVKMDMMDIHYPDQTFDVVYCSHVLEHVSDDRKAIGEVFRVLRPGGWAILQVPTPTGHVTLEDPTVTSPEERERLFGQHDHRRRYGLDYKDRLEEAGFVVDVDEFVRTLDDGTVTRCGLDRNEDVYFCVRAT